MTKGWKFSLNNQRGSSLIFLAVLVNVAIFSLSLGNLLLSEVAVRQHVLARKKERLQELSQNAVVLTAKLAQTGLLNRVSGEFSLAPSDLISVGTERLSFQQCDPDAIHPAVDGQAQNLALCPKLESVASFGIKVGDQQKVDFTTVDGRSRTQTQLATLIRIPATESCTLSPGKATFGNPEITTALGIAAEDWISADGYHAQLICRKLSYASAESYTDIKSTAGCLGKKMRLWSKVKHSFIEVDACSSVRHLTSVTCQDKQSGTCPCPSELRLLGYATDNVAASNGLNMSYYGSFGSSCVNASGQITGPSNNSCSRIYSGTTEKNQICALYGYSEVKIVVTDSSISTSDNSVAKWNSLTQTYDSVPALGSNSFIRELTCTKPIEAVCSDW